MISITVAEILARIDAERAELERKGESTLAYRSQEEVRECPPITRRP